MTTILIVAVVVVVVVVFVVALISPRQGTRVQLHTDRITGAIDKWLENKPAFVQKLFGKSTNVSGKSVKKSAQTGKKAHKKIKNA